MSLRPFTIFLLSLFSFASSAQEEKRQFIHKGLLRSQATISFGTMLWQNASTISIHGNLEYYVAENVSIRGDSYFFLQSNEVIPVNSSEPFSLLDYNHSTFSGASYHFKTKGQFDPYLALEPGITVVQSEYHQNTAADIVLVTRSANPLLSGAIGFNYYFQRWFHLFGEARYIHGKHLSDAPAPLSLSELRFSFGLGWNLPLIKPKN